MNDKKNIIIALLIVALVIVILSPKLTTQSSSSRLTKVGYLNVETVISAMKEDEAVIVKIENIVSELPEYNNSSKDILINKEIQKNIALSLMTIVRREGYTLILERTESTILYADRNFDITPQVTAYVRESFTSKK